MNKKIYSLLLTSTLLVSSLSANVSLSGGFYKNDKISEFDTDGIVYTFSYDKSYQINQNVDIMYGFSYENQKIKIISGRFDYLLLTINGKYNINSRFYTFSGLNFPYGLRGIIATKSTSNGNDKRSIKYTGELGFQLGLGYNINQKLAIELGYKNINVRDSQKINGLSSSSESTEIAEAITLNTKYTF